MSLSSFLFIYTIGGLTFIPLVLACLFLHAYITLPIAAPQSSQNSRARSTSDSQDDTAHHKSSTDTLEEKFKRSHESDVAAGYFTVCTNYTPLGINGRPPERTTPAGEVVAAENPGYYSAVYRSFFERKGPTTVEPAKARDGKIVKRALNVFYVVLRLGHLVLFDDEQMIEPRFVVPVANHTISVYGGAEEDTVPEGELFIKRNAICLTPKPSLTMNPEKEPVTYHIFSEHCSKKEDFYFALLQNQEKIAGSIESPPKPQQFDVEHIVTLVKRLHSSEQQLQTRWINALLGRLFLGLYKTPFLEEYFRKMIRKKISRVPKPNFITKIELQSISLGDGAPFITNPRLKDLTVDGDCCLEADVNYAGNFRVVISATARIDLGPRFKAREIDMMLAVHIKKLDGHVLMRIKPPPSNRFWVTFEKMPDIEMKIEPIVSTRQVTYTFILQAIEKRIRETFAESIVLPFWDDTPFYKTYDQHFRGGIWEPSNTSSSGKSSGQDTPAEFDDSLVETPDTEDRSMSMPSVPTSPKGMRSRKGARSTQALFEPEGGESTGADKPAKPPRVMRSQSFATAATPVANTSNANVDADPKSSKHKPKRSKTDATAVLMAINKSQPPSPAETPMSSPPNEPVPISAGRGHGESTSSSDTSKEEKAAETSSIEPGENSRPATPKSTDVRPGSKSSAASEESRRSSILESVSRTFLPPEKKTTLATIGSATAAAKQWGWIALQKRRQNSTAPIERAGTPENPIGRGRPIPAALGTPLPLPERPKVASISSSSISMPKRKPVPPPYLRETSPEPMRRIPNPPLPPRRKTSRGTELEEKANDELLVVAAPPESEPTSPMEEHPITGHMELNGGEADDEVEGESYNAAAESEEHEEELVGIPSERSMSSNNRVFRGRLSSSPDEEGPGLPSWSAAEEEESRSKSIWTNFDNGHG